VQDGSLSDELWHYNVNKRIWTLRAKGAPFYPPKLTRHTLTLAGNYIYLFGGSTIDEEFSSGLYKIKLNLCKLNFILIFTLYNKNNLNNNSKNIYLNLRVHKYVNR